MSDERGEEVTWLTDRRSARRCLGVSDGGRLLGGELDTLIYDAHSGFDPDSFGAALGALRGGGLLVLLTPPLDVWPQLLDPQASRIAVHPYTPDQVTGRFLRRFVGVLQVSAGAVVVAQGQAIPAPGPEAPAIHRPNSKSAEECRTVDQAAAVEAIVATARGRARRPLVLTSDRGRGKSSALGIAAAKLLREADLRIMVTAPRHAAVEPLFQHAERLLPKANVHPGRIDRGDAVIEFLPPDAVPHTRRSADLLFVDEAAGIPAPLLAAMLRRHRRVVFATTVHGYEGTGRSFDIRFRRTLDQVSPEWRELSLDTPVRWAASDPLEGLSARALLLSAVPAAEAGVAGARPHSCHFERLDRDALTEDEPTLSQIFGLLVLAHYQTRPMDLRHLLDGPNIRVYALKHGDNVAATALVAIEGGFGPELTKAVFEGRRRPRGHLLPQTLSIHAGLGEAPTLRIGRIVRIAVHPAVQGRGLGRQLLDAISRDVSALGVDLVGASFGATVNLLRFWARCGFAPAHLGTSRNAASGEHAAVVLRAVTPTGEALQSLAQRRLGERVPALLAEPLRDLEPEIAAQIIRGIVPGRLGLRERELDELASFALALRPYEAALPVLIKLISGRLGGALCSDVLSNTERDALIAKVLQHRGWSETASLVGTSGRAQVTSLLRDAVGKLLEHHARPQP